MKHINLDLYKKMYLIRSAEGRICEYYHENEMKTPVHLSIGEEAISAGVCTALGAEGQVFGTYRSHGIYLSRTGETDKFFAELYGKDSGLANGVSGSMHLSAIEEGFLGTSAIVGSIIPVAVGAAFANKMKKNGKISAVFFGDGAVDEGVFWESLNAACLMKLPVLFVCEDNGLAVHTSKSKRQGYKSILDITAQFDCSVVGKETTDAETIYKLTRDAMRMIKESGRPCFLYLKYYRYLEHVGINEDFDCGYRSRDEFEKWYEVDPVNMQRRKLLRLGFRDEDIREEEIMIDKKIDRSIQLARLAPYPDKTELYRGLYL